MKSEKEKFAGAVRSYTIEAMMGDTRALQSGTSHFLGQNFAKAFDIQFLDWNNELQYAWTTSWGLSTRFVGAIIMTHGDDQGLVLPPRAGADPGGDRPDLSRRRRGTRQGDGSGRHACEDELSGFRVKVDDRDEVTPGFKFNDWEMRGVPLRIEIGPKDVEKGTVALARRDMPGKAGKSFVPQTNLAAQVAETLNTIHDCAVRAGAGFPQGEHPRARRLQRAAGSRAEWLGLSWWCGRRRCEAKVKEDTKATTRCIPLDQPGGRGPALCAGSRLTRKYILPAPISPCFALQCNSRCLPSNLPA